VAGRQAGTTHTQVAVWLAFIFGCQLQVYWATQEKCLSIVNDQIYTDESKIQNTYKTLALACV